MTAPTQLYSFADTGGASNIAIGPPGGWATAYNTGDTVKVIALGTNVQVWIDYGTTGTFTKVADATTSVNTTATKHGVRSGPTSGASNRIDDFKVTSP
jgi:hypothetical protein